MNLTGVYRLFRVIAGLTTLVCVSVRYLVPSLLVASASEAEPLSEDPLLSFITLIQSSMN
jgi:hypothetical protein